LGVEYNNLLEGRGKKNPIEKGARGDLLNNGQTNLFRHPWGSSLTFVPSHPTTHPRLCHEYPQCRGPQKNKRPYLLHFPAVMPPQSKERCRPTRSAVIPRYGTTLLARTLPCSFAFRTVTEEGREAPSWRRPTERRSADYATPTLHLAASD